MYTLYRLQPFIHFGRARAITRQKTIAKFGHQRGHDICGRRHPRTQHEDNAAVFHPAARQLSLLAAAAAPHRAVPAPPPAGRRRPASHAAAVR